MKRYIDLDRLISYFSLSDKDGLHYTYPNYNKFNRDEILEIFANQDYIMIEEDDIKKGKVKVIHVKRKGKDNTNN